MYDGPDETIDYLELQESPKGFLANEESINVRRS